MFVCGFIQMYLDLCLPASLPSFVGQEGICTQVLILLDPISQSFYSRMLFSPQIYVLVVGRGSVIYKPKEQCYFQH